MDPKERWLQQQAEALEGIQKHVGPVLDILNDPTARRARLDASRMMAEGNAAMAAMPDAGARRAIAEATRFFDSDAFRAQRDGIMRAYEEARRRLSPTGLAAAQRIAARRTASDDGGVGRAAERLRSGHAADLLGETTRLASSPEVLEAVEGAEEESLARLDREEAHVDLGPAPGRPSPPRRPPTTRRSSGCSRTSSCVSTTRPSASSCPCASRSRS